MATLKSLVDETTVIKNELKTCHTNLKNNLSAKGVGVLNSDKMPSLINKINDITLSSLGGKKFATGTVTSSSSSISWDTWEYNQSTSLPSVTINLDFIPSTVILIATQDYTAGFTIYTTHIQNLYSSGYSLFTVYEYGKRYANAGVMNFKRKEEYTNTTSIMLPVRSVNDVFKWVAFE